MKTIDFWKHEEVFNIGVVFLIGIWWVDIEIDFGYYSFGIFTRKV